MPFIRDATLDVLLANIADNAVRVSACVNEPATYAAITAASNELGVYTLTAGDGNGDYTIANGDTSGRKLSLSAQTGTNASATGECDSLAFHDNVSVLYATVTVSPAVNLTSGVEFQINAFDIVEVRDPT